MEQTMERVRQLRTAMGDKFPAILAHGMLFFLVSHGFSLS